MSNLQPIQQPSSLQWPPLQQPQPIANNWRTPQLNKDFDQYTIWQYGEKKLERVISNLLEM
jgi:hypothetical protein